MLPMACGQITSWRTKALNGYTNPKGGWTRQRLASEGWGALLSTLSPLPEMFARPNPFALATRVAPLGSRVEVVELAKPPAHPYTAHPETKSWLRHCRGKLLESFVLVLLLAIEVSGTSTS